MMLAPIPLWSETCQYVVQLPIFVISGAVFVTSAAHYFLRSATTRWLMANRRYLGLSVAASHFWHLVAIVALIRWYPGGEPIATATIVFGGGGFVLLGLRAATANDASQRALGRGWRWLHKLGVYVV